MRVSHWQGGGQDWWNLLGDHGRQAGRQAVVVGARRQWVASPQAPISYYAKMLTQHRKAWVGHFLCTFPSLPAAFASQQKSPLLLPHESQGSNALVHLKCSALKPNPWAWVLWGQLMSQGSLQ